MGCCADCSLGDRREVLETAIGPLRWETMHTGPRGEASDGDHGPSQIASSIGGSAQRRSLTRRPGMTGTILAIDLGKFHSVACFYEVEDGRHEFKRIETTPRAMRELLMERKVLKVVIEVSGQAGW